MLIINIICFAASTSCGSRNGDYPQKSLLLGVLDKYLNSTEKMAAFTDQVCQTLPAEAQSKCYSGAFAMPAELLGFRNILESHSADRSDLCYMAQETGGFVAFYMHNYTLSECGATD
jgi:hypothetical protein